MPPEPLRRAMPEASILIRQLTWAILQARGLLHPGEETGHG